jgi:hypothetical protein
MTQLEQAVMQMFFVWRKRGTAFSGSSDYCQQQVK